MAAAYFQRPLMPEFFSAGEALDEGSRRTYDDWQTFLDAGRRFMQWLKYAGYNAAVVPIYHEGSTLYPSRLLEPTPRYDSGIFLSAGQDPVRKDVLEDFPYADTMPQLENPWHEDRIKTLRAAAGLLKSEPDLFLTLEVCV